MKLAWSRQSAGRVPRPGIGPRVRLLQAKDVPEHVILNVLESAPHHWWSSWRGFGEYSLPDAAPELAAVPWKVLNAKLDNMQRRGVIDGCSCGCRGDWHIQELFYGQHADDLRRAEDRAEGSPIDRLRKLLEVRPC